MVTHAEEKLVLKYAKRFSATKINGYWYVEINNPWPNAKLNFRTILIPKDQKIKKVHKNLPSLQVPLRSVITQSTTMLPYILQLGEIKKIVGINNIKYINTKDIIQAVNKGIIKEVGESKHINIELVYELNPSVVLTYGTHMTQYNNHPKLKKAGIPHMVLATYMEETLLGRSEWIKLFGLLFGKLKEAQQIFDRCEEKYLKEKERVKNVSFRPSTFCNAPYGGVWHMQTGSSWISNVITDAGGDYLWKHEKSTAGTLKLNIETVFQKALNADIWLNPGHLQWKSYNDVLETDKRYTAFKAYRQKKIFMNNKRTNKNGGNDIFEKGILNPDLILSDLIKIFHPELKPNTEFVFHQALKGSP